MKKHTSILLFILFTSFSYSQVRITPALEQALSNKNDGEYIGINIYLSQQADMVSLNSALTQQKADKDQRVKAVINTCEQVAKESQPEVLKCINTFRMQHPSQIIEIKTFSIINMIHIKARPAIVYELIKRDDIASIDIDLPIYKCISPVEVKMDRQKSEGNTENGLLAINAKPMWDMGYTGRNTILLSMDTGVWSDHPAISDNYLGNYFPVNQVWYGVRSPIPRDHASSSHGTHTTGTVLGLDPATNDTIGVAYHASWIASDPVASSESDLLTPSDFLSVFDWVLNPDGNVETTYDVPDVINNSWGYDYNLAQSFGACDLEEAQVFITIETAGISSPFSAGNEGPASGTTGFPAMLAFSEVNILSVGAVNGNNDEWPIADFSSRGPTPCIEESGTLQLKPEIVAPGYSVRSASGHNGYASLSGTSMSCPHVSGALLLLKEAFPTLSSIDLKNALYQTAIDLGEPGEDNVYGRGMIDVYAAYQYLELSHTPSAPVGNAYDLETKILPLGNDVLCPNESSQNVTIRLYNRGSEEFSNMHVILRFNGDTVLNSLSNGIIQAGDSLDITIENLTHKYGQNEIHCYTSLDIEEQEFNEFNNSDIEYFHVLGDYDMPYMQNFDTTDIVLGNSDWYILNNDGDDTWEVKELSILNNALYFNFYNYLPRDGQIDEIFSPKISLSDTGNINLDFIYAYQKRMEFIFKDSIQIWLSTDCGNSFNELLYANGGENMATVEGNAGNNEFAPENEEDWDTVSISLNDWRGEDIVLMFRAINDNGSRLYIDNVSISHEESSSGISNNYKPYDIVIYPNPAKDKLFVECEEASHSDDIINIYSIYGQKVASFISLQNKKHHTLNINGLAPGSYIMEYSGLKQSSYYRFVVE